MTAVPSDSRIEEIRARAEAATGLYGDDAQDLLAALDASRAQLAAAENVIEAARWVKRCEDESRTVDGIPNAEIDASYESLRESLAAYDEARRDG